MAWQSAALSQHQAEQQCIGCQGQRAPPQRPGLPFLLPPSNTHSTFASTHSMFASTHSTFDSTGSAKTTGEGPQHPPSAAASFDMEPTSVRPMVELPIVMELLMSPPPLAPPAKQLISSYCGCRWGRRKTHQCRSEEVGACDVASASAWKHAACKGKQVVPTGAYEDAIGWQKLLVTADFMAHDLFEVPYAMH